MWGAPPHGPEQARPAPARSHPPGRGPHRRSQPNLLANTEDPCPHSATPNSARSSTLRNLERHRHRSDSLQAHHLVDGTTGLPRPVHPLGRRQAHRPRQEARRLSHGEWNGTDISTVVAAARTTASSLGARFGPSFPEAPTSATCPTSCSTQRRRLPDPQGRRPDQGRRRRHQAEARSLDMNREPAAIVASVTVRDRLIALVVAFGLDLSRPADRHPRRRRCRIPPHRRVVIGPRSSRPPPSPTSSAPGRR